MFLRAQFAPTRAAYIARVLTPGELAVLSDVTDALIIARIKRMPDCRLARFEWLEPAGLDDCRLYRSLQLRWLRDEQYLVGTRLGRSPEHAELSADFTEHDNGLRFRAYFAMKYPDRVRPTCRRAG